jgi:hypothetical protein
MEYQSEAENAVYEKINSEELMKRILEVSKYIAEKTKNNVSRSNVENPLFGIPYEEVVSWDKSDTVLFWNMCVQASAGNGYIVVGSNGADLYNKCVDYVREHGWCKFEDSYYYYMIKPIADALIDEL